MSPTTHPDHKQLRDALSGDIDQESESSLIEHLDGCEQCQRELATLAASDDQWRQYSQAISDESRSSHASGHLSGLHPSCSWNESHETYPEQLAGSPADFAVSFLDPSSREDAIGKLGEYEILSIIGHGGMGIVLKGFQEELNRPVAVKVLAPHLAHSGAARKRFLREAQATAAIVHPNVMPILSVSEKSRLPFLVMPFVACHSLQQRIDADGPLPTLEILRIGLQVACGLAAAHAQGLVHRDVKPANILLERGVGRSMLTDFGLARAIDDVTITRSGIVAGTPQYMSPEQTRGETIDGRSDLFSLGSVIYAMCVGIPPFQADTTYAILRRITDQPQKSIRDLNPEIPEYLERLTFRLLEKDPADRFESASTVADILTQCLAHSQQPTVEPLPDELTNAAASPPVTRRTTVAALLVVLPTIAIWAMLIWNTNPPTEQRERPAKSDQHRIPQTRNHAQGTAEDSVLSSNAADLLLSESFGESTLGETLQIESELESLSQRIDESW